MPSQLGADADVNEILEEEDNSTGNVSYPGLFPPITSVSLSAGGIPPERQDFNALFALIGEHLYYMQQGGYYAWVDGQSYGEGAILQRDDGRFVRSLVDNNTADPEPDGVNWEYVIDYDALEADNSALILVAKTLDKINGTSYTPSDAESSVDVVDALQSIYENTSRMAKTGAENIFTATNEFRGTLTAVTQADGDSSTNVATTEFVQNALSNLSLPVGTILAYQGSTVPDGYLLCNGSVFSKLNYPELYELLGTNTTPNLVNKFLMGSSAAGTSKSAGLPNLYGSFYYRRCDNATGAAVSWGQSGVFSHGTRSNSTHLTVDLATTVGSIYDLTYFVASDYNSIYGNSTTVQPPALTTLFIICAK